jgi:hypothetical protein
MAPSFGTAATEPLSPASTGTRINIMPVIGILNTPVIDRSAGTMYFVADNYNGRLDSES